MPASFPYLTLHSPTTSPTLRCTLTLIKPACDIIGTVLPSENLLCMRTSRFCYGLSDTACRSCTRNRDILHWRFDSLVWNVARNVDVIARVVAKGGSTELCHLRSFYSNAI